LLEGIEACVFDMDGTLVDSEYDWLGIREGLGVKSGPIIEHLNNLTGEEREKKWAELHRIERETTQAAQVRSGASELLDFMRQKGIKTALVTNNSDESVSYLLEKFGLSFEVVVTRDSGLYKPSGAPVAEAVRRLGVSPEKTLCVGDTLYDILACREAGCGWVCILYDDKNLFNPHANISFADIEGFLRYLRIVL
jgi:HAD superfamily hydrolase (TIGR01509 family)